MLSLHCYSSFMPSHPPTSTLFPYTTLFRSRNSGRDTNHHSQMSEETFFAIDHIDQSFDQALSRLKIRRSEEHTSELQSRGHLVCRLLLDNKNQSVKHLELAICHGRDNCCRK